MQIPGAFDPIPVGTTSARSDDPNRSDGSARKDRRINLVGLSRGAIGSALEAAGLDAKMAKLRSKQLWHAIYHRGECDFGAMTDIAKVIRPWLAEHFVIGRPRVITDQLSNDGTRKWLLATADNQEFEMVFIPDANRATLCISSQVGCTLNCRFCHTGTMRLVRNLTPGEMIGQVMLARDALGEWPQRASSKQDSKQDRKPSSAHRETGEIHEIGDYTRHHTGHYTSEGRILTNIVLMGMGEPLYNFEAVKTALKIIMDSSGLALSKRRITLSTSGVVPMMARAGAEIGVNLAVSLHAVSKKVRDEIVPLNRKYGITALLEACAAYPGANNARRITFEYVMLKNINDSNDDARELIRLIKRYRIPAKVNLIPFNPWPSTAYECSPPERIRAFSALVFAAGISAPIRTPRGRDIMAACGQLKSAAQKPSRAAALSQG